MQVMNYSGYQPTNFKSIYPKNVTLSEVEKFYGKNSPFAKEFRKNYSLINNSDAVDMFFQRFKDASRGFRDVFLVLKKPFKTKSGVIADVGTKVRPNPATSAMAQNKGSKLYVDVNVDAPVNDYENMVLKYANKDDKIIINMNNKAEAENGNNKLYELYGTTYSNNHNLPTLAALFAKAK